jgi:flagellar basal body-associated protein FliL
MKKTLAMVLGTTLVFSGAGFVGGKFLLTPADASISADSGHGEVKEDKHAKKEEAKEPVVIDIGRVMVPVYRAKSIRYVVANMAISVGDEKKSEFLKTEEGKTKVRNYIITTMMHLAEKTTVMNKPDIDTEELSELVYAGIGSEFEGVNEILFLNLVQTETKRS